MNQPTLSASEWRFPLERGSESELLAASHIFIVTMVSLAPSPWAPQPSGLERRNLDMRARLDGILKGKVHWAEGKDFPVSVIQEREPGDNVSDYHGFWSHFQPVAGESYLALASDSAADRAADPAALLQEPAIRGLLPAAERSDFTFAESQEKALRPPAPTSAAETEQGRLRLVKSAFGMREKLGGLAATYVLVRAGEGDVREGPLADAMLEIILAPDTKPILRSTLASGLCIKALGQGATPAQRTALAKAIFKLSSLKNTADLFEQLAAGELYHVIFLTDAPALRASDVIPESGERKRIGASLKQFDEERADEIAAWLLKG